MEHSHVQLMGAHEIRIRLGGISRQRVHQLTHRPDFPTPVADLDQGKVWLADDVTAWMAGYWPLRRRRCRVDPRPPRS
jgi:prophage regulatory protein